MRLSGADVNLAVMSDMPLIHARGLTKAYGSVQAVRGIDLDVWRGEAFGFLGPNGAGKSSTMDHAHGGCCVATERR